MGVATCAGLRESETRSERHVCGVQEKGCGGSCRACLSPMEVAVTRMRIVDERIGVVLKTCPAVWKVEACGLEVVDSQVLIVAQPKASGGHLVAHLCLC